jgi:hypothetical protein
MYKNNTASASASYSNISYPDIRLLTRNVDSFRLPSLPVKPHDLGACTVRGLPKKTLDHSISPAPPTPLHLALVLSSIFSAPHLFCQRFRLRSTSDVASVGCTIWNYHHVTTAMRSPLSWKKKEQKQRALRSCCSTSAWQDVCRMLW